MRYTFGWDMFVVSINAGSKWPFLLILIVYGPCVAILNCLGQVLYLGRASCTKETLPDFLEWCRLPDIHEYSAG